MKAANFALSMVILILPFLILPTADGGNGFMGGQNSLVVEDPATEAEQDIPVESEAMPDTVVGPLNDKMSDAGKLFGDLYKILRYEGGESYLDYIFSYDDNGRIVGMTIDDTAVAIGGEPVLSENAGYYAEEIVNGEEVTYQLAIAPYPSQCVQPVASYEKWGDIYDLTGLSKNRLPLVMTYDATWTRTECEVGELLSVDVNPTTGELELEINAYFIPKCDDILNAPEQCTWNGVVYCDGVLWVDLVDEVHFGRLNLSRSPETVLQAAFDEAINAINKATSISRDAAGRLLLTTNIYEEVPTEVDGVCEYVLVDTRTKAIDSPRENLALYAKLMKDGHLVTPGDEREPIDRSLYGGIPLWKMLELSDGPSSALRPTIDIDKLSAVFPELVNVVAGSRTDYVTYYQCYSDEDQLSPTDCLCPSTKPDGTETWIMCSDVLSRALVVVDGSICPDGKVCNDENGDGVADVWNGITSDDGSEPAGSGFDFAAAFLAAAADKTGKINVDMVVYLNSILGINKVIGYGEDGQSYERNPLYFNFDNINSYGFHGRQNTFSTRGDAGTVAVLQETPIGSKIWHETNYPILGEGDYPAIAFRNIGISDDGSPSALAAEFDIRGFTQMSDDNLCLIDFIHIHQIPGLR